MDTPLKLARLRRKMTQGEAALAVGVVRSHFGRMENGQAKPSTPVARRLVEFFGKPLTRDQVLFPEEYTGRAAKAAEAQVA